MNTLKKYKEALERIDYPCEIDTSRTGWERVEEMRRIARTALTEEHKHIWDTVCKYCGFTANHALYTAIKKVSDNQIVRKDSLTSGDTATNTAMGKNLIAEAVQKREKTKDALKNVLNFVKRWNKCDKDEIVAEAASLLQEGL